MSTGPALSEGARSGPRGSGRATGWVTAALAVTAVGGLVVLRLTGQHGFPTDPLGALSLAGAAVFAACAAAPLRRGGGELAARTALALAASLIAYLAASVWAVAAYAHGRPEATVLVGLWNTLWIPVLACGQLTASAAIRSSARAPRSHTTVGVVLGAVALVNLLLTSADDPFAGLPTIAPEAWRTALAPLGLLATAAGLVALLVLPVSLWRAALSSARGSRARIGLAAAGATAAPVAVLFCNLLAIARDPGDVDPSVGSVAFLVALASATVFAVVCALFARRGAVGGRGLTAAVRTVAVATAAISAIAVGTLIAAPGIALPPAGVAAAVAVTAVLAVAGAWAGSAALVAALSADPDPPPAPQRSRPFPELTAREAEVLELLARGGSNAGIAAQLVISERTVDAHLRSVFAKLGIAREAASNQRVRAATLWWERTAAGGDDRAA